MGARAHDPVQGALQPGLGWEGTSRDKRLFCPTLGCDGAARLGHLGCCGLSPCTSSRHPCALCRGWVESAQLSLSREGAIPRGLAIPEGIPQVVSGCC